MTKEEFYGIYSKKEIDSMVANQDAILLKARTPVLVGRHCLLKINTNIGVSNEEDYQTELKKLTEISQLPFRPDSLMDHTIVPLQKPLWRSMVEIFDGAVGTLPHYLPFDEKKGISEDDFFDNLIDMAKGGVSFVTLHPTAGLELYDSAISSGRIVPMTSRGGFVLLKDQFINNRKENIVAKNYQKILSILKEYHMAISIGSVFRPGTIHEALDLIHIEETKRQGFYIDIARKMGVPAQMEGIGHIPLNLMGKYASIIEGYNAPLMPLGPMASDELIGFDHITNAVGASMMASTGVVGMINSVTREEHTGKVPSYDSVIEGLKTAAAVAHCHNISRFPSYKERTETTGLERSHHRSCVMRGGIFDYIPEENETTSCSRCKRECPLKSIY